MGGGSQESLKIVFLFLFGFLEVFYASPWGPPQGVLESLKIVFFVFWFSRGFLSFSMGPSPRSLTILPIKLLIVLHY